MWGSGFYISVFHISLCLCSCYSFSFRILEFDFSIFIKDYNRGNLNSHGLQIALMLAVLISKIARFDYPKEW